MLKLKSIKKNNIGIIAGYILLFMVIPFKNHAARIASAEGPFMDRIITLEGGGMLVPYPGDLSNEEKEKAALKRIFNDPTVYPHFLEGKPWDDEILTAAHGRAIKYATNLRTKSYEKLRSENAPICINWFLQVDGNLIGRGGIYWEPEAGSIPEVFLGIITEYQRKGWGTKVFMAIIEWFKVNILPIEYQPLRWLAKADNEGSKILAGRLGFVPVLTAAGDQQTACQNDIEYLVFEHQFPHES